MSWEQKFIFISCETGLRDQVIDIHNKIDSHYRGVQVYFKRMMSSVFTTKNNYGKHMITLIEHVEVNKIQGENFHMLMLLKRGAIKRIGNISPGIVISNLVDLIIDSVCTSSLPEFTMVLKAVNNLIK